MTKKILDPDINNAVALLEEVIVNGMNGMENLYAWFLAEKELVEETVKNLIDAYEEDVS